MYVRCKHCGKTDRIRVSDTPPGAVGCGVCGRPFSLARIRELGTTPYARYRSALEFSREHEIDLASSYSVLLGNMSLDVARALGRAGTAVDTSDDPSPDSNPNEGPSGSSAEHDYDAGFEPAVSRGTLTAAEAARRGDRVIYASTLARRHGLPMNLAVAVADNRISLGTAMARSRTESPPEITPGSVATGRRRVALWIAAAGLVVVVFAGWGRSPQVDVSTSHANARHRSSADVRTDDAGRVLEVVGPDPRMVLVVFCEASPAPERYEPVMIVRPPRQTGTRLGILRSPTTPERLYAIEIQERPGHWSAGDGRTPISVDPAPADVVRRADRS